MKLTGWVLGHSLVRPLLPLTRSLAPQCSRTLLRSLTCFRAHGKEAYLYEELFTFRKKKIYRSNFMMMWKRVIFMCGTNLDLQSKDIFEWKLPPLFKTRKFLQYSPYSGMPSGTRQSRQYSTSFWSISLPQLTIAIGRPLVCSLSVFLIGFRDSREDSLFILLVKSHLDDSAEVVFGLTNARRAETVWNGRVEWWAIRPFNRALTRTAHLFACSALFAALCSFARSLQCS